MSIVQEVIDSFPFTTAPRVLQRREELLLAEPVPGPVKLWHDQAPLEAVHVTHEDTPEPFSPPLGMYESENLRVEWQVMHDNRQPFYHRNSDVDELSFQLWGERTLITELGTVEHTAGDFSRIPRGVAHDNYGRRESHILFYVPAPVEELQAATRTSELTIPPFEGWVAAEATNELVTDGLGDPKNDVAIAQVDERLLLEQASREADRIQVLRADDSVVGTTWLYRSAHVLIGQTALAPSDGQQYRRHLDADEIQYQIEGHRTLVSSRGALALGPGDFVRIPVGVAFTSISSEPSKHLTLVSALAIPQVAAGTSKAEQLTGDDLAQLRRH